MSSAVWLNAHWISSELRKRLNPRVDDLARQSGRIGGGSEDRAREHFKRALDLQRIGRRRVPTSLWQWASRLEANRDEFNC